MVLNMHAMMKVLFLVLCSGILLFPLAANHLRSFTYTEGKYNWPNALNSCSSEGGSLLSLTDEEDDSVISNLTKSWTNTTDPLKVWLGLKWNPSYVPTWSNGEKVIFNESTTNLETGKQHCKAFENGTWKGFNCSEKKAFMCQNGNNYSLVTIEKNWCQAMQHCRTHFKDLASINNTEQNEELRNKSQGKSFWIGLRHDEFQWIDICSTIYINVRNRLLDSNDSCVTWSKNSTWDVVGCCNSERKICFKGKVKIRLIVEPKTWEEALNYCTAKHSRFLWIEDEEDQKAVQQWLKFTYTGFTNHLWIGLKQSSVFGFWIWSDRIVNYNNWEIGQQPKMPLSNLCGVIDAKTYTWSDEKCWRQLPFLCEEDIIYMKN